MDLAQFFLINQRFQVDLSRNSVYDLGDQKETRLELRHVNLLVQLCRNKGELVERDYLIHELWNDYGGGNDALTQSISVLRNILADTRKELIKTIPKKGYVFQGEISAVQPSVVRGLLAERANTRIWLYSALCCMILLAALLIFLRSTNNLKKVEPEAVGDKKFHYAAALDSIPPEEDKSQEKHTGTSPEGKVDKEAQKRN